jgi:hypothetical protein
MKINFILNKMKINYIFHLNSSRIIVLQFFFTYIYIYISNVFHARFGLVD